MIVAIPGNLYSFFLSYLSRINSPLQCSFRHFIIPIFIKTSNISLRKHAYSIILKISPSKTIKKKSDKKLYFFRVSARNIDCGYSLEPPRRGGSYDFPTIYVLSRNKKNNVYPCKAQFYYIKVGFKWGGGSNLYRHVFLM